MTTLPAEEPDFRVKSEFSRRRVPLHPALIRLGFFDYVAELRRKGAPRLFPEIEPTGPDGRLGYYYSKEFTEYRRKIGFYRPGADFHALRHTLATRLFNTDADTSVVSAVLGHAQLGVTASVYLSGYKLQKLAAALARVDFGIEAILGATGAL